MDLTTLTLKEAAIGLRKKLFTAFELTTAFLAEIKKKEKQINAFLTLTLEAALQEAANVDRLLASGQSLSLLAGIPVAVKDVIVTQGIRTTAASKVLEDFIPPYDATVIRKLKDSHAVFVGKTNCDEFAMGSSTENSAFKKTRNPQNLERVPGGSSGGSAAAVAANFCLYALGSDTGGSVRQPAALCGVVGFKPTYGAVSRYGLIAMASSLDQIGPLTKTVEDVAIVLSVIAGHDPYDATSGNFQWPDLTSELNKDIKGLKVGLPKEYFVSGLDPQVKEKVLEVVKKLESYGVMVEEVSLPLQDYALATYYLIMPAEVSANLARYDGIRYGRNRSYFGAEVKRRVILGTFALSAGYYDQYYEKATQVRSLLRADFEKVFGQVDVIVGPTSPTVAWKFGEKTSDPLKMYLSDIYTVTANLAGLPAISIPCGNVDGLPVGLQIMGPAWRDDLVLRFAYHTEQLIGYRS